MSKKSEIYIDEELLKSAESVLKGTGLTAEQAADIFLRQVIIRGKMPFELVEEND